MKKDPHHLRKNDTIRIIGLKGLPIINEGDDLTALLCKAAEEQSTSGRLEWGLGFWHHPLGDVGSGQLTLEDDCMDRVRIVLVGAGSRSFGPLA